MKIGRVCVIAEFDDKLGLVLLPKGLNEEIISFIGLHSKDSAVQVVELDKTKFSFEQLSKDDSINVS